MKGIVLIELLKMAERALGEDAVDQIIDSCKLPSGGAYTAVGRYSCDELMALVQAISDHSGVASADLKRQFGQCMLAHFAENYSHFFADKPDALAMLEAVENEVHVEVRKLYPDAELPRFESERLDGQDALRLTYHSPRDLGDFCQGMVEACVAHFGTPAQIDRCDLGTPGETVAEFTVRLKD